MNRRHIGILAAALLLPGMAAQAAQKPEAAAGDSAAAAKAAAFVAADVHPSPVSFQGTYFHNEPFAGDRYVVHQATPLDLITKAYQVAADAVTGGPPGLEFDHYDIVASTPPGTPEKDTVAMLQTLLAERFKLVVQKETKPLPAFVLKPGIGALKMKQAAEDAGEADCDLAERPAAGTELPPTVTLKCVNMTMERFAEQLRDFGWQTFNHPVVDGTGMKGAWNFDFRFTWRPGTPDAITIFEAVKQLGLKIEPGTAPRPALAIVSMADAPTPNAPGIEKLLPAPPPPSFDVATIKPSKNESKEAQVYPKGPTEWAFTGTTRRLISLAWDISEKTIFDAPAYSDEKIWDIDGKMPVLDTPLAPGKRPAYDFDKARLMLRSLLMERFDLKAHTEQRPGNGYTLLPSTPKMKKGNPADRASCTYKVPPGEKDPRVENPMSTQYMHCTNVTVDQFARELKEYSGALIKTPVLNKSGIEGRYDLSLSFSGIRQLELLGLMQGGATPKPGAAANADKSAAAEPTGVPVMITDAVAKQLGLKLVLEKRPIPALVIDHINELPTEN